MKVATLLALSASAYGLAFDGPLPTPVTDLVFAALTGMSPKPTLAARALPDLFRRQRNDPAVCGYLDGDSGMSASLAHYPDPTRSKSKTRPPTRFCFRAFNFTWLRVHIPIKPEG
jgi:hypothetical protein